MIPTVLCGGSGSRLWPVSRELHPKQFIKLEDGQSLLQKAWLRATSLPNVDRVVTVSNRDLYFKTKREYSEISYLQKNQIFNSFMLEPFGRNTAAAIAVAALHIARTYGEDSLMLVLPADHLVGNLEAFADAVEHACRLAVEGKLVTFGIQPQTPETGYGYIEVDGNNVLSFVEKPGIEKAREFSESGRHLWNSGMFCFTVSTLLREMELHCPAIVTATRACLDQSPMAEGREFAQCELDATTFNDVTADSIDYGLMQKSSNIAVVPCNIGWSDIGSWKAIENLVAADERGNHIEGDVILHAVNNCYIHSPERLVGAVGVNNLLIIDTADALLIADRDCDQDVKLLYNQLKDRGHEAHKRHRTEHRPWGVVTVLEEGPRFKIKRIEVKPGASLSTQMHFHRSEHWIVVSGIAKVVNGEHEMLVHTNESTYIPAGHKHRLENPGIVDVVIIEVQSGEYLGEDDIVRFDDRYGRLT